MSATILILEKAPWQRNRLASLLERAGYLVLCAESDEEALHLSRRVLPDLLVLGLPPGGGSPEERVQRLRSALHPELRVLLRAGGEPWRLRQAAVRSRADDWVHRLDSNRTLLECVATLTDPHPRLSRLPPLGELRSRRGGEGI